MDFSSLLTPFGAAPPLVTVLRLHGSIGRVGQFRSGIDAASSYPLIERAFAPKRLAAVALSINSPGGAPVQSSLIHQRIRQKAAEKKVPVLAFVEDVGASGGYWLALAADEIFADENSIVGSIGVIAAGFGFTGLIERLGIERRVYAQGTRKAMLDPFRPENPDDIARVKALQAEIHDSFKAMVRSRRGGRLKGDDEALFNGDIWTGRGALALGLVDGIGELRATLRQRFGDKVRLRLVAERKGWLRRRLHMSAAEALPEAVLAALEERALWGRLGL